MGTFDRDLTEYCSGNLLIGGAPTLDQDVHGGGYMSGSYERNVTISAAFILILNLADAVFTLLYTGFGLAVEGNPLMDQAMIRGPVLFMAVKLALVSGGVLVLWQLRQRPAAVVAIAGGAAAYAFLIMYHLREAHRLVAFVQ